MPANYLGSPLIDSALKHSAWQNLLDKIEARLSSWTFHSLNLPSRLTLVKSVLQSMPIYLFSVLAAPKWVLKQIQSLQRNFLWGASGQNRKWALVKWTSICHPKYAGGLGLRDPQHINAIMGAKVWWQWLSSPLCPWARLWTAKYAHHRPTSELICLLVAEEGSQIWNATKQHRLLILEHSFWEVCDGRSARFWTDSWQQQPKLITTI